MDDIAKLALYLFADFKISKNMTKKMFFLLCAAIAVLLASALSSCEKDSYQKSPITEKFFKIVDETHINTYDQLEILCTANKEVSFEIRVQDDQYAIDTLYIAEDEDMDRNFMYGSYEDDAVFEDENILFSFKYRDADDVVKNSVRVIGMLQKSQSSTAEDPDYLLCKSDVVLKATIQPMEMIGNRKIAKVLYELKCDSIVLASATQNFLVIKYK